MGFRHVQFVGGPADGEKRHVPDDQDVIVFGGGILADMAKASQLIAPTFYRYLVDIRKPTGGLQKAIYEPLYASTSDDESSSNTD